MAKTSTTSEVSDDLLGRLNAMLERITEASENQLRLLEERIKDMRDRGETTTQSLIESIEEGMRAQIESLREEIEQLRHRIGEIIPGGASRKRSKRKAATKKKGTKKATKKSTKNAAKKAAKKKSTKKSTKKKSTKQVVKKAKKPAKKKAG